LSGYILLNPQSRDAGLAMLAVARNAGLTTSVDPQSAALITEPAAFLDWVRGVDLLLPNEDALAVLAATQLGAERVIAMSRHESRQRLAREYGATDIVEARGDAGVDAIKELTDGLGAHSVVEAVGTQESMMQAIHATRAGGNVGFVGVTHDVAIPGMDLFWSLVGVRGGPAPVRRFLPELIDMIWTRQIEPGKVFDLELPLDRAADGYRAMDQRDAIKVLLRP